MPDRRDYIPEALRWNHVCLVRRWSTVTEVSYRGLRQRLLAAVAFVPLAPVLGLYGYLYAANTVGLDVLWPLVGKRWYGSVYVTRTTAAAFVVACLALFAIGYRLRRDAAWRALEPTAGRSNSTPRTAPSAGGGRSPKTRSSARTTTSSPCAASTNSSFGAAGDQ